VPLKPAVLDIPTEDRGDLSTIVDAYDVTQTRATS
jgi:hypothetical protein